MKQIFTLIILLIANILLAQKPRLVVPIGHILSLTSVAFSPNGKYVLTGSIDNTAKLWDLTGREMQTFKGHTDQVLSVAFSPDGNFVLTGSADNTAKLWDLSGSEIQTFKGHVSAIHSVAFSPVTPEDPKGGKYVLTGSADYTAKLWDFSGQETLTFLGHTLPIMSVVFAPNGKQVLTGSQDGKAKLWDLSGNEIQSFKHKADVLSVAFSPDGNFILTGCKDKIARLWNVSGKEIQEFKGHGELVSSVAFSPDGKRILTGSGDNPYNQPSEDRTAKLWDLNGREIQTFTGHDFDVRSVAFSPVSPDDPTGGKYVLTGSADATAKLWDLSGREIRSFIGHSATIMQVAFSPGGKDVLIGSFNHAPRLWDLTKSETQSFVGHQWYLTSVAYSPDGKYVLSGSWDQAAKMWDLSGQEIQSFDGHTSFVDAVAFSPDGKNVLTGSWDQTAKLWDLSGQEIQSFEGHKSHIVTVAFSPPSPEDPNGGKYILTGSQDGTAKLWGISGQNLMTFEGHTATVSALAFSPNGKNVLTGSLDNTLRLWDLSGKEVKSFGDQDFGVNSIAFSPATPDDPSGGKYILSGGDKKVTLWDLSGREIRSFKGHSSYVESVAFSPDRKYILTGGFDNMSKIWDTDSGKELATLIAIDSNDWVVTTPSGLFDASPGAMQLMHYMVGLEVVELKQLKTRYYEPYLLQKVMGFMPGGLRPVDELNNVPLYPEVLEASIKNDLLKVRLKARSGGIGRVALELDGSDLVTDANPTRQADFQLDLKPYLGFFSPSKPNHLSLKLYNEKGWVESQSYVLEHPYDSVTAKGPGDPVVPRRALNNQADASLEKIHFYALVVGTSKYRDEKLNLKYPEKDASIFADALRKAGGKLFKNQVEVQLLSTETEPWPRKAVIRKALSDIQAKAGPDDILLVYFSGHGITYPPVSEDGQFYYLTTDIAGDNLKDEAILKTQAIAQDSLMDWVRQIKARKRILIYDACNSGSVVNQFEAGAKDLNTDQRRALERMKDRTGMYVLAGSAADKSSYEASNYGHGLLTYSLINGMLSVAAKKNTLVEVGDLFAFVEDDVERLAKNINREQRPEVIKAESYPIGIIDNQTDIKMPTELPVFVRVSMMDDKKNKDLLGMSKIFNAELERISSGKTPAMVFWDVESYAGKYYYLGGQYESIEGSLKGNASLYLNDTELKQFPISGSVDALGKLAKDLIFEVQDYLAKNPGK